MQQKHQQENAPPSSQNTEKKKSGEAPGAQPGFSKVDTPTVPLIVKRSVGEKLALPRPVDVSHRAQAWSLAMTERGVDDQLVLPSSMRGVHMGAPIFSCPW